MGLLSKILENENLTEIFLQPVISPVRPETPAEKSKPEIFQAKQIPKNLNPVFFVEWAPCPKCNSPLLWMDAYKTIRCCDCDPPAFRSAVRRLSLAIGETVADLDFIFGDQKTEAEFSRTSAIAVQSKFSRLSKTCRCGSRLGVDVKISGGRVRRDCAKCGRFIDFTKW